MICPQGLLFNPNRCCLKVLLYTVHLRVGQSIKMSSWKWQSQWGSRHALRWEEGEKGRASSWDASGTGMGLFWPQGPQQRHPASSHEEMELTRVCPGWHELARVRWDRRGGMREERAEGKQSCSIDTFRLLFLLETGGLLNHRTGKCPVCLFMDNSKQAPPGRTLAETRWRPVRLNIRSSCLPGNYRQSPKLDRKTMKGTDRAHCRPSSEGLAALCSCS